MHIYTKIFCGEMFAAEEINQNKLRVNAKTGINWCCIFCLFEM